MAKKKPAAVTPLKKAAEGNYWAQELDLQGPSSDSNYQPGPSENAPHGGRPAPDTRHPGPGGASGGGGSAGGGAGDGTPAAAGPPPPPDWEQAFIAAGMPPTLISQVNDYLTAHANDPDLQPKVIAIIRGSDWWKQTFPGFWEGATHGLFSDETGYRAWYAGANDAFKRYYGRDMNAGETVNYLHQGYGANDIEQIGQGHAYATANAPDLEYYSGAFGDGRLNPNQLENYGQYKAGKGNAQGAGIDTMIQNAMQRAQRVFQGVLAQPNFGVNQQGLLSTQGNKNPDLPA